MKLTRIISIAVILGSVGVGALQAQTRPGSVPAEFPPSSFKGKQYVDSKGCVFIRAGIDGNVSWIPRVTRQRTGVCGFKPTFAGQVAKPAAPEPVQSAAAAPEVITNPAPAAAAPAPRVTPKPAPTKVVHRAPAKPKVVRQVARAPAPVVEVPTTRSTPVRVVRTAKPATGTRVATACPNASALGQQYLRRGDLAVRCGPQSGAIVAPARGQAVAAQAPASRPATVRSAKAQPIRVSPNRRIVPRHVAIDRINTTNVAVPKGYKRVWEDDRLNPNRAEQSLAGHREMTLIWTSTVPRRLINQTNGRDVTASVPLVYPFLDYTRQQRELGQVTIVQRDGQTLKRVVRNAPAAKARKPVYSSRSKPAVAPKPRVQSKPVARVAPKAEAAATGFVQVGSFGDAAAAQRQAKKIRRMGLPVRIGKYTRNGQTTRLVIAGPFGGKAGANGAVQKLRRAGFTEAFAR
ncbi:SPOR domain-containing protein [Sulfitobacter sp. S190]|uniref:SPOR domain-containing protein n=1 Tax=Sulfitobacter sp. S190 TaxID=2867022 RepID=UPI0021A71467|nr:SPOR domain-containing protein [Sulfitobacter sp. S190]UWR23194.1 SPOR domain-containing protein [Sulfitobacter sp. S190]